MAVNGYSRIDLRAVVLQVLAYVAVVVVLALVGGDRSTSFLALIAVLIVVGLATGLRRSWYRLVVDAEGIRLRVPPAHQRGAALCLTPWADVERVVVRVDDEVVSVVVRRNAAVPAWSTGWDKPAGAADGAEPDDPERGRRAECRVPGLDVSAFADGVRACAPRTRLEVQ